MGVPNTGVLGPQTAAALGTLTGVRGRGVVFKVVTSGTETVSVSGVVAGTTATTGSIMAYNIATGALHSSVAMDDGTFYIPKIYTNSLTFTGSGSSDTKTVTYSFVD